MKINYHTHTTRCRHASGSEREYIETAITRGLDTIGFSDHAPYVFDGDYYSGFRMRPEELAGYCETLAALREEYRGQINILIGLEAEYYPKFFGSFLELIKPYDIEYLILGQHFLDNETEGRYSAQPMSDDRRLTDYVSQLIAALETGKFSYAAHPDLIAYDGGKTSYLREMERLCRAAYELDIPLEINMLGLRDHRRYPNPDFWRLAGEIGCRTVIGCDAHEPGSVAESCNIAQAYEFAARCGVIIEEMPINLRKI